jgi:AraC-like DNA-binding protein
MQSGKDFKSSYYVFPNTNISLNFHTNIRSIITDHSVSTLGGSGKKYVTIVQGMRDIPVQVNLRGSLDKMTVAFHPVGLNPFIRQPYLEVAASTTQLFNGWDENPDYKTFMRDFYSTHNEEKRIALLEKFLLSIYQPNPEWEILRKAVVLLKDFSEERSVAEIAKMIGMPERSFSRLFHQQVGVSPARFKKIARFRHSLTNKLFNQQFKRLTEIGHASNFYDQAYFINTYREFTRKNPKAFFKEIDRLADDQLILSYINAG